MCDSDVTCDSKKSSQSVLGATYTTLMEKKGADCWFERESILTAFFDLTEALIACAFPRAAFLLTTGFISSIKGVNKSQYNINSSSKVRPGQIMMLLKNNLTQGSCTDKQTGR